jgi:hypothetical protein
MIAAMDNVRQKDMKDKSIVAIVALTIGSSVGYLSFNAGDTGQSNRTSTKSVFLPCLSVVLTGSVAYWYLRHKRREMRLRLEEDEAREFFSRKSASGNKY